MTTTKELVQVQARKDGNVQGIDVSRYQGKIDWLQVKADKQEFAFIKATEGQTYTDPNFVANVKGALSAGLLVGTYHFLRATSAAAAKAEAVHYAKSLEEIGGAKALQLPPVMDYENNPGGISKAQINIVAKAFLVELERLTGIKPIIYTGNSFAANFDTGLSGYDLWIARYSNTRVPDDQPAWKTWTIWQYSDVGKVPGIVGNVDLNEFNGSLSDLKARYGKEKDMSNPFDGYRLTSPFGMRKHPVSGINKFHRGVDLVVSPADGPINAFVAGEVIHAKLGVSGSGFGNYGVTVAIKDDKGYLHVYAHLSAVGVKVGQQVKRGQLIGKQGSTGISSGPHLHYEVRKAASPQYGYTATEAGVVEPTQYLINYYGQTHIKEDKAVSQRDINVVSPWAAETWAEVTANGYFDGTRPAATMTREEAAVVFNRLRKNILALLATTNGNVSDLDDRLKKIEAEG